MSNINKKMSELISIQVGAVVSREIVKAGGGNITLFAFDKGQGLSEHTTPFQAIILVIDGEMEIAVGGKSNRYCGGEIVIMPAGSPHALRALAPSKIMLIMIKDES